MKRNRLLSFLLAASSLLVIGCASEDTPPPPLFAADGVWSTGCWNFGTVATPSYMIDQITVTDAGFSRDFTTPTTASDSTCTADTKLTVAGSFAEGTTGTTPVGGFSYTEYDVVTDTILLTPLNDGVASGLNIAAYCGFTDWANGVAKDITLVASDATCLGVDAPALGNHYGIYSVQTLGQATAMFLGDLLFGDGTSLLTRPTEIDENIAYYKL